MALGHALAARGHDVEMLYTEISDRRYDEVARALGFTARSVASPIIKTEAELYDIGLKIINTWDPLHQGLLISRHMLEPVIPAMYDAGLELAKRSDLLIHHFILHSARAAAELTNTPAITVAFAPMLVPSQEITPPGMPRLGAWANLSGWKIARTAINFTLLKDVKPLAQATGTAAVSRFDG